MNIDLSVKPNAYSRTKVINIFTIYVYASCNAQSDVKETDVIVTQRISYLPEFVFVCVIIW
jgi:hypothetical protein